MFVKYSKILDINDKPFVNNLSSIELYDIPDKAVFIDELISAGIIGDDNGSRRVIRYADEAGGIVKTIQRQPAYYLSPGAKVVYDYPVQTYVQLLDAGLTVVPDRIFAGNHVSVQRFQSKDGVIISTDVLSHASDGENIIAGYKVLADTSGGSDAWGIVNDHGRIVAGNDKIILSFDTASNGHLYGQLIWNGENAPNGLLVTVKNQSGSTIATTTITPGVSNKNNHLTFTPEYNTLRYINAHSINTGATLSANNSYTVEITTVDNSDAFVYYSMDLLLWPTDHAVTVNGELNFIGEYQGYRRYKADHFPLAKGSFNIDLGTSPPTEYYLNNITGDLFVESSQTSADSFSYSGTWVFGLYIEYNDKSDHHTVSIEPTVSEATLGYY